uniref:T-cell receptor alpha/delta variable 11.0.3 n=1 Tax=Cyprinus carpio TaxID=7962 RepID=A0A8C2F0Y5_CYPCA
LKHELICKSFAQSIAPLQTTERATEREIVILSCKYDSQARSLHWYRQYPGSRPEFLLLVYESNSVLHAEPPFPRLNASDKKHLNLEISETKVADAAIYYCALVPTVTGNPSALYKNLRWFAVEGDSVTLSCSYTGSVRGLHWYLQYAGSPPKILILDSYETVTKADPPVAGVSIHHRKYNSSVDLKISSAAVTDSALYTVLWSPQ